MQCPYCSSERLKVLDTADSREAIRRRRECLACGARFTTYERAVAVTPVLIKADGTREAFDREKLKRGIWHACAKRPIPALAVERLATNVERYLQALGQAEVSSRVVGDKVISELKDIDPIAYVRYAIVYLKLDSLYSVRAEIDKLLAEQNSSSAAVVGAQATEGSLIASNC
ncbi:MAG: transcriptional repressor NrdR [Candidatus Thermofonsia Clade 1 bacterium]|jgi:transcriptional repressor NrdR|uniref:Transcriptional repressor NrdR n=1 Tax=Candidatus Thermofonsia Clade 1 bacterium TaxID=2364210 RepID=A0A2M8PWT1_9CHLR|nr:MAG: transcriptional repressor NrdR [Candidatus Thermofonsia Clade 1 bacterium]PJF42026.1 MAG: transcriptional repressor NrdR [Candidatus Thermofonsia Clade 1 bacterium]RMF49232.1 MAG: transcriptional repressor NrdR [Chloroflexota bacterium]